MADDPPTTAPPTLRRPRPDPLFSTSRTSSITAHSRQIAATMAGEEETTATARGGSDLTTGLGFTQASVRGLRGGAARAPGRRECWLRPGSDRSRNPAENGPIPTRLNSVIAIAAMMRRGWV